MAAQKNVAYIAETDTAFGSFDEDAPEMDDLIEKKLTSFPFHIGQTYEPGPALMIRCKRCQGTAFEVGTGDCFTAIRCVSCLWEYCIHDG